MLRVKAPFLRLQTHKHPLRYVRAYIFVSVWTISAEDFSRCLNFYTRIRVARTDGYKRNGENQNSLRSGFRRETKKKLKSLKGQVLGRMTYICHSYGITICYFFKDEGMSRSSVSNVPNDEVKMNILIQIKKR